MYVLNFHACNHRRRVRGTVVKETLSPSLWQSYESSHEPCVGASISPVSFTKDNHDGFSEGQRRFAGLLLANMASMSDPKERAEIVGSL